MTYVARLEEYDADEGLWTLTNIHNYRGEWDYIGTRDDLMARVRDEGITLIQHVDTTTGVRLMLSQRSSGKVRIQFRSEGRLLLEIRGDGTVTGEIEDAGEAARVFVEEVRRLMRSAE